EKIYEELLATSENTIETHHEKIMKAKVAPLNAEIVKEHIKNLCTINNKENNELTVLKMKQIVPEFVSNNSKYQMLDK
ncbi:MAG: polysaccharide biosynthesis protein, partial [Lutibacter sp.]